MTVAVVIPALDEEATIGKVIEAVNALGPVIVVDDGSIDATANVARSLGAIVVRHDANRGYDAALASGFRAAVALGVDVAVAVDADGEQVLDEFEAVLSRVECGEVMLALGVRDAGARFSERAFSTYTKLRFGLPDALCGVKAYHCEVLVAYDAILDEPTIGTGVALAALAAGMPYATFAVPIRPRRKSRFGSGLRPNLRILRAMATAMARDVRIWLRRGRRTRSTSS